MKILLNVLGVIIFFLLRFDGRADKTKETSLVFWAKDNWVECIVIALFDFALLILGLYGGLQIDFTKIFPLLPDWVTIGGDMALSFAIGLFGGYAGYSLVLAKVKYTKEA
jgi:hypothetical protein